MLVADDFLVHVRYFSCFKAVRDAILDELLYGSGSVGVGQLVSTRQSDNHEAMTCRIGPILHSLTRILRFFELDDLSYMALFDIEDPGYIKCLV
jgi:hypothetical protein